MLAAKAATAAAFAFPVALLGDLVSFELGQRIFAGKHLEVTFGHPGVLQALVFGAVAVSLVAIIGVGLGGLIRHTAGATTALALVIVGGAVLGSSSGRPASVPTRHRTPGRRNGPPLGGAAAARHRHCGPRRLRRHRPGGGIDADGAPRRLIPR